MTTTTQKTAQATGSGGVRGSRSKGSEGPHQDFMIFYLRGELPLLVIYSVRHTLIRKFYFPFIGSFINTYDVIAIVISWFVGYCQIGHGHSHGHVHGDYSPRMCLPDP